MHILITGDKGVGKSTLIRRLLEHTQRPLYGFITKKEAPVNGISPVYIHSAAGEHGFSKENLVALCGPDGARPFANVFDTRGVELLSGLPEGALVLMDELGFLENEAERFLRAALDAFCHGRTVIAALKPRSTPFLDRVRAVDNALLFHIHEHNRDALFEQIMACIDKRLSDAHQSHPLLNQ